MTAGAPGGVDGGAFQQLSRELLDQARAAERLQGLARRLAADRAASPEMLVEAQQVDLLVQHLDELAGFCERLSEAARGGPLTPEAVERAADESRLSLLAHRLSRRTHDQAPSSGDCELW